MPRNIFCLSRNLLLAHFLQQFYMCIHLFLVMRCSGNGSVVLPSGSWDSSGFYVVSLHLYPRRSIIRHSIDFRKAFTPYYAHCWSVLRFVSFTHLVPLLLCVPFLNIKTILGLLRVDLHMSRHPSSPFLVVYIPREFGGAGLTVFSVCLMNGKAVRSMRSSVYYFHTGLLEHLGSSLNRPILSTSGGSKG